MFRSLVTIIATITALAVGGPSAADDGPPVDLGPTDVHQVGSTGLNQPVLVIHVQAQDYRVLAGDLVPTNQAEDQKVASLTAWWPETSWNTTTFAFTQQRAAGSAWYTLDAGLLDYCTPDNVRAMEARAPAQASTTNPTPPSSITAAVGPPGSSEPASEFDATSAGNYWYGVSSFRNGAESTLTRISAPVAVAAGDLVRLTITRPAANDVDRYLVYRIGPGGADVVASYARAGATTVSGPTDTYIDTGRRPTSVCDHYKLLTDAMTAAAADVANFEAYNAVIAILYSPFLRGQAAGAVLFDVNGTQFTIQSINQSSTTGFGRFTHEMGHLIGLPDEYDPVTSYARGYWTTMDGANDRQYAGWEKDYRLAWITAPGNVMVLARPSPGSPDLDQTFDLLPTAAQDTVANVYTTLKIVSSPSVHYYVEARDHIGTNVSDAAAANHVVLMEAADAWPPGIWPRRNLNLQSVLASGGPSATPDPNVEVAFTTVNAGPPETFNVRVRLKAQAQPDPSITPWGAPPWESPDVWVDSSREGGGFDDPATAVPKADNGEAAWVNHVNRVYAKITNSGAADATGVRVKFSVNTPGGFGDAGQFVDLPLPAPVDIPAGASRNVYAEWTPTVGTHTCIKVDVDHVPGEADINNNFAQENVTHFYTGSASPWHPVQFPIRAANPLDVPKRVYLELQGLRPGWTARLGSRWVDLKAKEVKTIDVTITPPPDAPECTKSRLELHGLMQLDDFIQPYGGLNPVIHLANPIRFGRLEVGAVDEKKPDRRQPTYGVRGLTVPSIPNAEIAIILAEPGGDDRVVFARTDAEGAFATQFEAGRPGRWTARAYYAGDDCHAPTEGSAVGFDVVGWYPKKWGSLHGGFAFPLGSTRNTYGTGYTIFADLGYRIAGRLSAYVIGGFAHLPANGAPADKDLWHLNANLRFDLLPPGAWSAAVNGGGGWYWTRSPASSDPGANVGAAVGWAVRSGLVFELGGDVHSVRGATSFATFHLGAVWAF